MNRPSRSSAVRFAVAAVGGGAFASLPAPAAADAPPPQYFTESHGFFARYDAYPLRADFNGDGVHDFALWTGVPADNELKLISGTDGQTLRTYTGAGASSFGVRVEPAADLDGDGLPEIVTAAARELTPVGLGAVHAISSRFGGGNVSDPGAANYRLDGTPMASPSYFGLNFGMSSGAGARLLANDARDRVLVYDVSTGTPRARLSKTSDQTYSGLGTLVHGAGDLNGDGIEDLAVSEPGYFVDSGPAGVNYGVIHLVDGRVATVLTHDVPMEQLDAQYRLARLSTEVPMSLGAELGHGMVNLGDPTPLNGVDETLLVVGTPYAAFGSGGFAAFLLKRAGGSITWEQVASHRGTRDLNLGWDVADLVDLDGDGVRDLGLLEPGDGSLENRGSVSIISGAALLDGYQGADVLQVLADSQNSAQQLFALGDYNGDGRFDIMINATDPFGRIRIFSVPDPASGAAVMGMLLSASLRRVSRTPRTH